MQLPVDATPAEKRLFLKGKGLTSNEIVSLARDMITRRYAVEEDDRVAITKRVVEIAKDSRTKDNTVIKALEVLLKAEQTHLQAVSTAMDVVTAKLTVDEAEHELKTRGALRDDTVEAIARMMEHYGVKITGDEHPVVIDIESQKRVAG